jgi:hypothetical protein
MWHQIAIQRVYVLLKCAVAAGWKNAVPSLSLAHWQLMALDVGDLLVAIFGDGPLGADGRPRRRHPS